jgi:hypothetical protein
MKAKKALALPNKKHSLPRIISKMLRQLQIVRGCLSIMKVKKMLRLRRQKMKSKSVKKKLSNKKWELERIWKI